MVLIEALRHSFPKGLRFNRQCRELNARLRGLERRHRHHRYIPRKELEEILGLYEQPPYRWMKSPFLSRVLLLNLANVLRSALMGVPSQWIVSYHTEEEIAKVRRWLNGYDQSAAISARWQVPTGSAQDRQDDRGAGSGRSKQQGAATRDPSPPARRRGWTASKYISKEASAHSNKGTALSNKGWFGVSRNIAVENELSSSTKSTGGGDAIVKNQNHGDGRSSAVVAHTQSMHYVDRERFLKECLEEFKIATIYHATFINCSILIVILTFALGLSLCSDYLLYLYLFYWRGLKTREKIKEWFFAVEEEHLLSDIPKADGNYKSQLPPPALIIPLSEAPMWRAEALSKIYNRGDTKSSGDIVDPRTGRVVLEGSKGSYRKASQDWEHEKERYEEAYVFNIIEMRGPAAANGAKKWGYVSRLLERFLGSRETVVDSPDSDAPQTTVLFIPMPHVAPEPFYRDVGALLRSSDVLLLEGVDINNTHRLPANTYFPTNTPLFASVHLSHRFYDILTNGDVDVRDAVALRQTSFTEDGQGSLAIPEPPMLLPAALPISWRQLLSAFIIPYNLQILYNPSRVRGASKADATIGWGWLMDAIDMIDYCNKGKSQGEPANDEGAGHVLTPLLVHSRLQDTTKSKIIAVPWSLCQIVNLEASLIKQGYEVVNVMPIKWCPRGYMGERFCDYFNID